MATAEEALQTEEIAVDAVAKEIRLAEVSDLKHPKTLVCIHFV